MSASTAPALTVAELERALTQADPAALLVPPRILRRVIKRDRGLGGLGLQVPHRKSYVIGGDALLRIADRGELGLASDRALPETVLLFPRPDPRWFLANPAAALLRYWRLLFHARVHVAVGRLRADGKLGDAAVRERIRRLGPTECQEVRAVLRQEHFLLPPAEYPDVYEEFAALYLELRYFAPHLLPRYFPGMGRLEDVDALLSEDVDASELFAQTRLPGAPDPGRAHGPPEGALEVLPQRAADAVPAVPDETAYRRLLAKAEWAASHGNRVRAAIFRRRATLVAPTGQSEAPEAAAREEIETLLGRLRNALQIPEGEVEPWRQGLLELLGPAAGGVWPVEARLLYDLQKVCIDHERPIYAVDMVEWVVSWGGKPIKRLLPNQGLVLSVKHLRSALHRLTAVRIHEPTRRQLVTLLIDAVHHAEKRLRQRFHPLVESALDAVGLRPENFAERVSRDKLIEELLDRVVERGFLTMGDLRDAVARNQLKLEDLTEGPSVFQGDGIGPALRRAAGRIGRGLRTFFLGDRLLRANRQFSRKLDGVYRRGEVYLRWLQRLSAAAFGTHLGRLLTLYLFLPFGGAFFALKGAEEIIGFVSKPVAHAIGHATLRWATPALGLFLLGLIHVPPFRRVVADGLAWLWRGLRALFYDFPAYVLRLPWVRRILQSRPYLLFYQFVVKPLVPAALVVLVLLLCRARTGASAIAGAAVFLAATLLLNSRAGMTVEEVSTDAVVRTWQLLRSDVLPGLFRLVMYVFQQFLEQVERLLYTVDEMLRFRPGDSRWGLVWKPAVGLVWFCATYLIRVVINLFVEPTFNPIKHFPVVTVAAKLILPFAHQWGQALTFAFAPFVGKVLGGTAATVILFLLPGLAGFLVWEFKENWKLYRANRAATLRPIVIGSHGETMLRFMKPGLHSGTLPKLYAKLRRHKGRPARKQYEALHHAQESLRHFIERNLLAVLASSKSWGSDLALHAGPIKTATNRVRFELSRPDHPGESIYLDFEEHAGYLVAGTAVPPTADGSPGESWLHRLDPEQVYTLHDALAGLYKMAGVDLVREQIDALLPPGLPHALTEVGLVVWPAVGDEGGAVYELRDQPRLSPRPLAGTVPPKLPALAADALLFDRTPVYWSRWVEAWERDQAGKGHEPPLLPQVRLLPAPQIPASVPG